MVGVTRKSPRNFSVASSFACQIVDTSRSSSVLMNALGVYPGARRQRGLVPPGVRKARLHRPEGRFVAPSP